MTLKLFDFDLRWGILNKQELYVKDYFQFYTIGAEEIIEKHPNKFIITERFENERAEILTNNLFDNANISDLILAINNDTYLWDTPVDGSLLLKILEGKMKYIRSISKVPLTPNEVDRWTDIFTNEIISQDTERRSVIIPKTAEIQRITRYIKDYFKSRTLIE